MLDNRGTSQSLTAKNLGVVFDPTLSFDQHIKEVTKTAFFHLRSIDKIRSFLSIPDPETLIYNFVALRPYYCNVFLSGILEAHT